MQKLYPTEHLAVLYLGKIKTGLPILQLLEEPFVEDEIGHTAAVNFMNHLVPDWAPLWDLDHRIFVFSAESNCIMMIKDEEERGIYQSDDSSTLGATVERVYMYPNDPIVNHYLFESTALIIKRASNAQMSMSVFESHIVHHIMDIVFTGRTQLWPYAFQIFAVFVECKGQPLAGVFYRIFESVLSTSKWYIPENVPALVRLLQAFIQKLPHENIKDKIIDKIKKRERLEKLVAIFNRLVTSSSNAQQAFYMLNTIIDSLKYEDIRDYMPEIWNVLFRCLKENFSSKLVKSVVTSMSLFLVNHGSANLVDTVTGFCKESDVFLAIIEQLWIPNLKLMSGALEVKLTTVASTRLMSESPALLDAMTVNLWRKMLESTVVLLSRPRVDRFEEEHKMLNIAQNMDCILYYARKKEEDPLWDVEDLKKFLSTSVPEINDKFPKRYSLIIQRILYPANQGLQQILDILQNPCKI